MGPFQFTMQIPTGATWTNDSITSVNRSQGLTVQWSGGNPSTQAVAIIGYSSNPATNVSGAFACLSSMAAQSYTVPSSFLVNLPATPSGTGERPLRPGIRDRALTRSVCQLQHQRGALAR